MSFSFTARFFFGSVILIVRVRWFSLLIGIWPRWEAHRVCLPPLEQLDSPTTDETMLCRSCINQILTPPWNPGEIYRVAGPTHRACRAIMFNRDCATSCALNTPSQCRQYTSSFTDHSWNGSRSFSSTSKFHLFRFHIFGSRQSSSSKQSRPPRRCARGVGSGTTLLGDNWQYCRSLDDASDPDRSLFASGWRWFRPTAIQMRCGSLSPIQWPHTGSSSYSASRCPRQRLFPIDRRPSITQKIDLESMTSQGPPNFRLS